VRIRSIHLCFLILSLFPICCKSRQVWPPAPIPDREFLRTDGVQGTTADIKVQSFQRGDVYFEPDPSARQLILKCQVEVLLYDLYKNWWRHRSVDSAGRTKFEDVSVPLLGTGSSVSTSEYPVELTLEIKCGDTVLILEPRVLRGPPDVVFRLSAKLLNTLLNDCLEEEYTATIKVKPHNWPASVTVPEPKDWGLTLTREQVVNVLIP
jgi:hypothetical protein